jgi:hypothetical protein
VDLSGPITGGTSGQAANHMQQELADRYHFKEDEFFLSGKATKYAPVGTLGDDGAWNVTPDGTAPYTTRVLVRRPADPKAFNGIVVVEWYNVSSGIDGDPDFGLLHPLLLQDGYAHVAVSAQQAGVGEGPSVALPGGVGVQGSIAPLKQRDPQRYGPLTHPGDDYSYDIATQVGQLARHGDLVDGAHVDRVILTGESQSAARLTTYIDAVQPIARAYDAFLVHSRNGSGAPLAGAAVFGANAALRIRTDLQSPVFQFQTESDVARFGFLAARQPNTDRVVTWEVAGTSHADATLNKYAQQAIGVSFDVSNLCGPINDGPQAAVFRAAFQALIDWMVHGKKPPEPQPFETTNGTSLARDRSGIVLGGARTPAVDAPTSVLSGENVHNDQVCNLFGSTTPMSPTELAERYPTHDAYVNAVTRSADDAVGQGVLLPSDRDAIVADAQADVSVGAR